MVSRHQSKPLLNPVEEGRAARESTVSETRRWSWLFGLLVGCALLAGLVAQFGIDDAWRAMRHVQLGALATYFVLAVVTLAGYSARSYLVARSSGAAPALLRFLTARLAGDAAGALLPGGRVSGDPLRVAILYARGSGGVRASSWIAIDRMMEMIGNTLAGLAYVTVFALHQTSAATIPVVMTLLSALFGLAVLILLMRAGQRPLSRPLAPLARRWPRLHTQLVTLAKVEDQLCHFFQEHAAVFFFGLLLSLAIEGVSVLEYDALFRAFGLVLDLPTLLLALVATGLARGLPTPAGLGALEAGQVAVLTYAMGRADLGFVAGVILRLHETLWLAIGAVALIVEQGLVGVLGRRRRTSVDQDISTAGAAVLSEAMPVEPKVPR